MKGDPALERLSCSCPSVGRRRGGRPVGALWPRCASFCLQVCVGVCACVSRPVFFSRVVRKVFYVRVVFVVVCVALRVSYGGFCRRFGNASCCFCRLVVVVDGGVGFGRLCFGRLYPVVVPVSPVAFGIVVFPIENRQPFCFYSHSVF